ncbi:MAG: hypothetical protein ROZ09_11785 [Thiobacillus sp.]|nr:hypothetical protein [Thiobacillus sp.]MDT3707501.1 hypothetical protein [Thiobacillus sp.]
MDNPVATAICAARCGGMNVHDVRLVRASVEGMYPPGLGLDADDLAALGCGYPFDHAGIEFLPGVDEQPLLGEVFLGVEDQYLGARFIGLEVVGDHARAFGRAGRAAERHRRRVDDGGAAVGHGVELLLQQQCLRARFPGMRHHGTGGFVVAFDGIPAEVDARRHHQAVVFDRFAAGQRDEALARVDPGYPVVHHVDAVFVA